MQLCTSPGLSHLDQRFKKKYNLLEYIDIDKILNHKGIKYVIFEGSDIDRRFDSALKIVNNIRTIKIDKYLAISKNLYDRIKFHGLDPVLFEINLVDNELFKPVSEKGNIIYIYNSLKKIKTVI